MATLNFKITPTPFGGEPENAHQYYEALGRVMCLWGRFETAFTIELVNLIGVPGTEEALNPFPMTFNKRIKAFRKCFAEVKVLSRNLREVDRFAALAKDVAKERHLAAHGHFW